MGHSNSIWTEHINGRLPGSWYSDEVCCVEGHKCRRQMRLCCVVIKRNAKTVRHKGCAGATLHGILFFWMRGLLVFGQEWFGYYRVYHTQIGDIDFGSGCRWMLLRRRQMLCSRASTAVWQLETAAHCRKVAYGSAGGGTEPGTE